MTQSDIINNNFSKAFECIKCSNAYDTGAVLSEEKLFKQISERKHSTFDLSKFTVVGSPTITEDGIASGFSSNNYITNSTIISPTLIKGSFTVNSKTSSGTGYIFQISGDGSSLNLFISSSGYIQMYQGNKYLNYVTASSYEIGIPIYYEVEISGTTVTLKLIQNNNVIAENTGEVVNNVSGTIVMGKNFNGSIDLKQFSITVDGKEVFSGNKTGLDVIKPDNYTVVGSPVISADGVASGFNSGNSGNSVNIPLSITSNKFTIEGEFTFGSNLTTFQFCCEVYSPKINRYIISLRPISDNYLAVCYYNGTGTEVVFYNQTEVPRIANKSYKYKIEIDGTTAKSTINGITKTINNFVFSDVTKIGLGCNFADNKGTFFGSIDLNSFKIYTDGQLVYQPCLKIPYTQSKTGSKIVDVAYRDRVIDLYEQEGKAKYYTIDESNKNFTLPMGEIYGMIENIKNTKSGGSGLEVGDISMALYVDETKGLRRYLNGQIVDINTNTQAFLNRLLEIKNTNPDYFATEENWQSEALLNIDGCVYKFVLNYASNGETVVSVRLPKYPDYVEINAGGTLPVVGNGMTLGLTDGTSNGALVQWGGTTAMTNAKDALYGKNVGTTTTASVPFATYAGIGVVSDPTKSGIQTTLNQTKLKMRYFIQIATGSETEANIVNDIELNNPYVLFDNKYVEAPLYNLSWLKSDGEYKPKTTYPKAYEALVVENNSSIAIGATVDLPSGTKYTKRGLSVKLSTDESVTDYDFRINTTDETFRLPLKNGQEGVFASGVKGNGLTLGVTNGTGVGALNTSVNAAAIFTGNYNKPVGTISSGDIVNSINYVGVGLTTDPTKSGIVIDTTVPSGWNLYFYVGETVQNANLIDAGRIGEQLAGKQDKCVHITDTYRNGTSWYRIWSDGWCEQGGTTSTIAIGSTTQVVSFLKEYPNTNYSLTFGTFGNAYNGSEADFRCTGYTPSSVTFYNNSGTPTVYKWQASGYLAE